MKRKTRNLWLIILFLLFVFVASFGICYALLKINNYHYDDSGEGKVSTRIGS